MVLMLGTRRSASLLSISHIVPDRKSTNSLINRVLEDNKK